MTDAQRPERILLVFVDGVGLPDAPLEESVYARSPTLMRLLKRHCRPIDACLGVPGRPQSATGQTAIFTGLNAPETIGAHQEGFPDAALRRILTEHSLFRRLRAAGRSCTFANAYARCPGAAIPGSLRSVTTVMTLDAPGDTRTRQQLLDGDAVYHDIVRDTLPSALAAEIPRTDPETAGHHLLGILRSVDLCLFEFFLTDHRGHRGTLDERYDVLERLDRMLAEVTRGLDPVRELLLMVSDHGNIEDLERRGHTTNPVPFVALGAGADHCLSDAGSLLDVTPLVLELLAATAPAGHRRGDGSIPPTCLKQCAAPPWHVASARA